MDLYFNQGKSWKDIAEIYGCFPSNLAYYFRKYGLKGRSENGSFIGGTPWNKGKSAKEGTIKNDRYLRGIRASRKYGSEHPMYKGGWIQRGYHYISDRGQQKAAHRKVVEQVLGRKLSSDEIVHHDNHTKTDNRPENLVLTNRSEHVKIHPGWRAVK